MVNALSFINKPVRPDLDLGPSKITIARSQIGIGSHAVVLVGRVFVKCNKHINVIILTDRLVTSLATAKSISLTFKSAKDKPSPVIQKVLKLLLATIHLGSSK